MTPERITAAEKYIAEREAKRQAGMDIPKHRPFETDDVPLSYVGTRVVEGQSCSIEAGFVQMLKRCMLYNLYSRTPVHTHTDLALNSAMFSRLLLPPVGTACRWFP